MMRLLRRISMIGVLTIGAASAAVPDRLHHEYSLASA
jgi:hypothetical protein